MKHIERWRSELQNLLRNIRMEANMTQSELAEKLNKPQSFVSKYEAGERKLDIIEIYFICECLGIKIQDFVKRLEKQIRDVGNES